MQQTTHTHTHFLMYMELIGEEMEQNESSLPVNDEVEHDSPIFK